MFSRFVRFVGQRYILAKRKKTHFLISVFISVGGIALGVSALIVVLSVMNGFGNDLKQKMLGAKAHFLIESRDFKPFGISADFSNQLKELSPEIQSVTPFVSSEMMIRFRGQISGVLYKGNLAGSETREIEIGKALAEEMRIQVGSEVDIISPVETMGPLGTLPKTRKYRVKGFIETGIYQLDTKLIYVPLAEAQQFLERSSKIDGIEVYVSDLKWTSGVLAQLREGIGGLQVRDWRELNQTLFHALRLEKWAMFVILSFVILVAVLNVITTVSRSVLERKREISIFQAMGASKNQILFLFLVQGLFFGGVGILGGSVLGLSLCWILGHYPLIRLPEIYYFTSVPVEIDLVQVGMIMGVALGMTLLASLYPAWRAAQLDPLEGLQS